MSGGTTYVAVTRGWARVTGRGHGRAFPRSGAAVVVHRPDGVQVDEIIRHAHRGGRQHASWVALREAIRWAATRGYALEVLTDSDAIAAAMSGESVEDDGTGLQAELSDLAQALPALTVRRRRRGELMESNRLATRLAEYAAGEAGKAAA